MIKIISGWSNKGGSTFAFIKMTNELNKLGYDTTFFGPHNWHLDKCKSGLLDSSFKVETNDRLIVHFLQLPNKPPAKKVILSCHEKDLFKVSEIKQFWDEVVFLNEKHRNYHKLYTKKFSIIPNLKESFIMKDKKELEKIAGVIGSFDENKQTHISIERALEDGCEKVYLFGNVSDNNYYNSFIKPLINEKVIEVGFMENKQDMYDMIGRVYQSSKSECASLTKDECESTGTKFFGNYATDYPPNTFTNEQIINMWINILEL